MEWCCLGFEGNYGNAGNRGAAVLVGKTYSGNPEFTLQFRAVDPRDETNVQSSSGPLSLVMDVGLKYCAWCGVLLGDHYESMVDRLYRPGLRVGEGVA